MNVINGKRGWTKMRDKYMKQLENLNNNMIEMGAMIEKSIENAISALVRQDVETAKKAIEYDAEIDEMEKNIENMCMKILLSQQPVASDLRTVSSALKMVTDMERIGDHAADISEITIMMADKPYRCKLEKIEKMAKETMIMLVQSIESYVNKDIEKAKAVINHDDIVDGLFDEVKKALIVAIKDDDEDGEQMADLLMVAKYLERIGDHATNISESCVSTRATRWSRPSPSGISTLSVWTPSSVSWASWPGSLTRRASVRSLARSLSASLRKRPRRSARWTSWLRAPSIPT